MPKIPIASSLKIRPSCQTLSNDLDIFRYLKNDFLLKEMDFDQNQIKHYELLMKAGWYKNH